MAYRNPSPLQRTLKLSESPTGVPHLPFQWDYSGATVWLSALFCAVQLPRNAWFAWFLCLYQVLSCSFFGAVSSFSQNKRICCETDRGQMVLFCLALDLQTRGLVLNLCSRAEQMLCLTGAQQWQRDKDTTVQKSCPWYHRCCGNFPWLEGNNIL